MKQRTLYFGPPGTGKTEKLMQRLEHHLKLGVPPERIAFLSFSRRAIAEAKERAKAITDAPLPWFRTIHSLAYRLLELTRGDVLQRHQLLEFGEAVGIRFRGQDLDTPVWEGTPGDQCLALHQLAQARCTSLAHEYEAAGLPDLSWDEVSQVSQLYERYKTRQHVLDFSDMIAQAEGELDVDVLFVDEAQDTSTAQWKFLRRVGSHVPVVYFAGDDDQAVYEWSGADPRQLLRFQGERTVLPKSYRLPGQVKQLADTIAGRIHLRVPKQYTDRGEPGTVQWYSDLAYVDPSGDGTWLLLARSNYQLKALRKLARSAGVVYNLANGQWSWELPAIQAAITYERLRKGILVTRKSVAAMLPFTGAEGTLPSGKDLFRWEDTFSPSMDRTLTWMHALPRIEVHDREYLRMLRLRNEPLGKPGRVRVGTVHSVKGAQADHVVLLTDLSDRVARAARSNPDAELRVQYVGVTRARRSLTLIQPSGPDHWAF